jgi:hypothetical protein
MHFRYVFKNRRFATLPTSGDPTSYKAEDGHGFLKTYLKCQIFKSLPRGEGFREGVTLTFNVS